METTTETNDRVGSVLSMVKMLSDKFSEEEKRSLGKSLCQLADDIILPPNMLEEEKKLLRKYGLSPELTAEAAENGYITLLKYAHENGCPWNITTCEKAARNGHTECLKYAHENGCPWDEMTCRLAAKNGHLKCLKYAHENGCPWDEMTCRLAAENGHQECLRYAIENGCPCPCPESCHRLMPPTKTAASTQTEETSPTIPTLSPEDIQLFLQYKDVLKTLAATMNQSKP